MKHFHLNSALICAAAGIAVLLVDRQLSEPENGGAEALLAADRAFSAMSVSAGAKAAWGAFLTDDAMILGRGSQPNRGLANILPGFDDWPAGASISWQPQDGEVADSGELGWTWGRYVYTAPGPGTGEDGAPTASHGKYLNIWKKQADGSWKVTIDMGNQNPAPGDSE